VVLYRRNRGRRTLESEPGRVPTCAEATPHEWRDRMGESTILRDGTFAHPTLAESLNGLFMAMDSDSSIKTQRSTIFDQ
jgi:hypothetical protein